MPSLILTRAQTYSFGGFSFVRGRRYDNVPEGVYHGMIRRGIARDPDQQIDWVLPKMIKAARKGSRVPIVRDMGLGDVLMTSIPLRDFAQRMSHVRLVYAMDSRYVPIFEGLPFAEVCSITDLRGKFQYGVDLRGYCERAHEARHQDRTDVFANYLLGGGRPSSYDFPIVVTEQDRVTGRRLARMSEGGSRPTVGLVMRASLANRSWGIDYLSRFEQLASREGWRVVLLDGKDRSNKDGGPWGMWFGGEVVDLTGKISLLELKQVTAAVDVILSPDTGTAHLAEAVRTRCVSYFTTVPPALRVSHYRWMRVLYPEGELKCLGCIHQPRCGQPDPKPCATLSTPQMAWDEVQWIHEATPPWPLLVKHGRPPAARAEIRMEAVACL